MKFGKTYFKCLIEKIERKIEKKKCRNLDKIHLSKNYFCSINMQQISENQLW